MKNKFTGPLFIVGLSRSGTKLIRDLINRNDIVSIPEIETHFMPAVLLDQDSDVKDIHKQLKNSSFANRFPKLTWPSLEKLNQIKVISNKIDFIETILKYYALENINQNWTKDMIWGDKTPSYLRHLDLLNKSFPDCKFIHIIRDPRDRALSVKKTWRKSMYRATELWRREIQATAKWKQENSKYIEIHYEKLLTDTEEVMKEISRFLEIDYTLEMLSLSKPSEKYGRNSNQLNIGKQNKSKFHELNPRILKRVEEIAYPVMKELGYDIENAKEFKPFPPFKMVLWKFIDFINFKVSVWKKEY